MNSAPDVLYYIVACTPTLVGLFCEWRAQYIVTILGVMYAIALGAIWLGHGLTFIAPLISTILVLNSRGLVRLLMYGLQKHPYYGWYLTGCASLIAACLQWFLLAAHKVHLPFIMYLCISALMQVAAVPWLIKRKPGTGPTYWPVVTIASMAVFWLIAFLIFAHDFRGYTPH